MATYMADKVVVYDGTPGIDCTASSPQVPAFSFLSLLGFLLPFSSPSAFAVCIAPNTVLQGLLEGMNKFLRQMEITFRRDPENFRPRINKMDRCCC
jgi:ATP-binding cassette subfamily E protein 1